MSTPEMRQRWQDGQAAYGAWLVSGNLHVAEVLGRAGFDWVGIDAQHGLSREAGVGELIRAVAATGTPSFVRTATNTAAEIGWALDMGATGVIVPMVNSAAEAEEAVAACRYAPRGNRSWGPLRAALLQRDYSPALGDASVLCFAMAETVEACQAIDEIAAIPGLDGIFVGPSDLAISCGQRPSLAVDSALVRERIAEVLAACGRAGTVPGIYAGAPEDATAWAGAGFRLIGLLSDINLVEAGARRMLEAISCAAPAADAAIAARAAQREE